MIQIAQPFQNFVDTSGQPLDNGYIFIGSANQNPETNPIAVYWDSALTIPAAQPIRTINGYMARNGSPARLYADASSYSITVRNSNSVIILTAIEASTLDNLRADLAASSGSSLVNFISSAAGSIARTVYAWLNNWAVVKNFVDGDGIANDTTGLAAAVAQAYSTGKPLYWNGESCLTTATIPNFHDVKHIGRGAVARGTDTWTVGPARTTTNKMYVSPTGNNANDGLSSAQPLASIQTCIDKIHKYGPVIGRQQIVGAGGTYNEKINIPDGLAQEDNYLEFKFPTDPGVRGDPTAWPAGGAILSGTGLTGNGIETGQYNKVYIEYLLVKNWYDNAVAATSQVVRGINVSANSILFVQGVSAIGNGFENIGVSPAGFAVVTGGILDGARYSCDATAGRISFSATNTTYTTIKNALEYGLHVKHNASAVLDFTEFLDCGQTGAAATYGAALFAYKSGASIDTRSCTFKRNNIVYNARGGFIATHPSDVDVLGTGADVNDRIWLNKGFGQYDLINYRSQAGREISQSFGGGTVTGATALAFDSNATVPAGYLTASDQNLEIEIYAANAAGGTAQIRPSMVTPGGTRYELGNFQVAASTNAKIHLVVQTSSVGTVASVYYDNIGATLGGTSTGQIIVNPIVFDASDLEFQVWGDTTAANVLSIRKCRCILWG